MGERHRPLNRSLLKQVSSENIYDNAKPYFSLVLDCILEPNLDNLRECIGDEKVAVILDMDGVSVDTQSGRYAQIKQLIAEKGLQDRLPSLQESLSKYGNLTSTIEFCMPELIDVYQQLKSDLSKMYFPALNEYVKPALELLTNLGFPIPICTTGRDKSIENATLNNIREIGYPMNTMVVVRPEWYDLRHTGPFKYALCWAMRKVFPDVGLILVDDSVKTVRQFESDRLTGVLVVNFLGPNTDPEEVKRCGHISATWETLPFVCCRLREELESIL
ncbi:MAG: hypothetical protein NZM26_04870 [Patescibacteria group bacterium]|nr:hypothetical protein [Patescibacteria group bacterium]